MAQDNFVRSTVSPYKCDKGRAVCLLVKFLRYVNRDASSSTVSLGRWRSVMVSPSGVDHKVCRLGLARMVLLTSVSISNKSLAVGGNSPRMPHRSRCPRWKTNCLPVVREGSWPAAVTARLCHDPAPLWTVKAPTNCCPAHRARFLRRTMRWTINSHSRGVSILADDVAHVLLRSVSCKCALSLLFASIFLKRHLNWRQTLVSVGLFLSFVQLHASKITFKLNDCWERFGYGPWTVQGLKYLRTAKNETCIVFTSVWKLLIICRPNGLGNVRCLRK